MTIAEVVARLRQRGVGPEVIARVERLNPAPQEGEALRGLHFKRFGDPRPCLNVCGKGEFVRRFGREAWEAIPRDRLLRRGRRAYAPWPT
jgi:hypothetical protein